MIYFVPGYPYYFRYLVIVLFNFIVYDIIYIYIYINYINIKDGNGNPRWVLKNQIDFKLDLGKIKKRKCKTKVKRTN